MTIVRKTVIIYSYTNIIYQSGEFVNSIFSFGKILWGSAVFLEKGGRMCEICRKYRCPPNCPSYEGRSAEFGWRVAICRVCGRSLYEGDAVREYGGRAICEECAEEIEEKFRETEGD